MKRTLDAQASHAFQKLATGLRYVREAEKALRAIDKARRLARVERTKTEKGSATQEGAGR